MIIGTDNNGADLKTSLSLNCALNNHCYFQVLRRLCGEFNLHLHRRSQFRSMKRKIQWSSTHDDRHVACRTGVFFPYHLGEKKGYRMVFASICGHASSAFIFASTSSDQFSRASSEHFVSLRQLESLFTKKLFCVK